MVAPSWTLGVVLVVLVGVGMAGVTWAGLPLRRAIAGAAARAVVQLTAVSAVIAVVLGSIAWTFAFVAGMLTVATLTSTRRMALPVRRAWAVVPMLAVVAPVVGLVLASGAVPWEPASILPIAGIVVGNSMTATTLAGRRMLEELGARVGEYEAALSLGFSPAASALEVARPSAGLALIPLLDQTRTVGLVTLPGAYIGVLLGGGTPVEAGSAQVLVLVGVLAAQALAVAVTVRLVASRRMMPDALRARLPR
jgi:putative ABC transport system permease protein